MIDYLFRDKNAPAQLSRELHQLIEKIGETKTREQQELIIKNQIQRVRQQLQGDVDSKQYPDIMVKLIYFQTLGYSTSFAKILPIKLSQSNNLYMKKISYLLSAMLVKPGEKLAILMHNTILKDLQSDNVFVNLTVLTMLRYFLNEDLVTDCQNLIKAMLKNKLGMVRRKALFVMFNMYQKYPHLITNINEIVISALSDPQVPVAFGALCCLKQLIMTDHIPYKNQVGKLVEFLDKIVEHKYPSEYDYHRVPAPWTQIDILKMLEKLGRNDQASSKLMYDILDKCLRRSQNIYMVFNRGIMLQCIKTISNIYPHQFLLSESQKSLSSFFDGNNNLMSFGLAAMTYLVKSRPKILQKWQLFLVECLQSEDITLAQRTINLLIEIANSDNTQVILNKIISLTQKSTDPTQKRKLIKNGIYLIQRFSSDRQIFLRRMNEIFYKFQDFVSEASINNFLKTLLQISEIQDELPEFLIHTYIQILQNFRNTVLVKVSVWILAEMTYKLYQKDKNSQIVDRSVQAILACAQEYINDNSVIFYIMVSLMKLSPIEMTSKHEQIKQLLMKVQANRSFATHKIGQQFIRLAKYGKALYASNQLEFDPKMKFLSNYVQDNYEIPNKNFLISKKKYSKRESNDLDLFSGATFNKQSTNNIFEFKAGHRWGQNPQQSKKQIKKQIQIPSQNMERKKDQIVLRGPHQEKKTKNKVDQSKAKLAKSIFGPSKKL